jgi:hypothetical protein
MIGAVSGVLDNGELNTFGFHRQWQVDRQGSGDGSQGGAGEVRDGQVPLRQLAG